MDSGDDRDDDDDVDGLEHVVRSRIQCEKDSGGSCLAAAAAAAEEAAAELPFRPEVTARTAKAAASVFGAVGGDGGTMASKSSTSYPSPLRVGAPVLESFSSSSLFPSS